VSPIFESTWLTIYNPASRPLSFVLLEVFVLAAGLFTLRHALGADRAGDRVTRLTWLTIFLYGLVMEAISYEAVQNFAHGQFTVMFYDRQLPLYIITVYPVLLYTGIWAARRLGLGPIATAMASGLCIVALDVPFDLAGPRFGWWHWFGDDPNVAVRWHGVPVTSFYWHLMFGSILSGLTALAARRRRPPVWMAFAIAGATVVLGVISFLPYHLLAALGVGQGTIVAGAIAGFATTVAIARTARRR
jgi:hypothetical protein